MIRIKMIKYSVSLNYIKNLSNKDRTMIIHHGLMGSCKNFRGISKHPNISDLVSSFIIDARNHGQSPHTQTLTMQDLADDLKQFIIDHKNQKQSNWNRITLMGHSMGGIALMEFTNKYPQMQQIIDRIIIVDISTKKIDGDINWQKTKKMLENINNIPLNFPKQQINKMIDKYALSPAIGALLKMGLISKQGKNYWRPNIPTIVKQLDNIGKYELKECEWKKPVQVIYGSLSNHVNDTQIKNYKNLYPQMRQQNFHKVQGSGHWVHSQKPLQFLQIMKKILLRDQI